MAVEQAGQPLVAISVRIQPARIAQREHEQMNLLRLRADPDLELAVIDLGLFAGTGLEAHRRQLRPPALLALRPQPALHLHDAAGEAQPLQLPVEHCPVKADLGPTPLDKLTRTDQVDAPGVALAAAAMRPA